jgi:Transposase DDE domain
MTPALDLDWRQVVSRFADPDALDASARACGAIQRSRQVRDGSTLLRLALMWAPGGHSLRTTAALAEAGGVARLSDVALLKRLRGADEWLENLCGEMLARRVGTGGASKGRAVRILDGSRIAGPGKRAWRLHLCYDLSEGRISDLQLTDTSGAERLERLPIRAGEIRIGDRVYAKPGGLAAVRAADADLIVRCSWNSLRLRFQDGRRFSWGRLFEAARKTGLVDAEVLVDNARVRRGWQPVPMRLIILPKPPAAAAHSRRQARRDSQRDQHRLDPRTLAAAEFMIVLTSLPAADYPAQAVLELYRLRWQIEIAFKRLKSQLRIDRLPAKDPDLARTWLYAHLLFALTIEDAEDEAGESPP